MRLRTPIGWVLLPTSALLLVLLILMQAPTANNETMENHRPKTDIDTLARLIELPQPPTQVHWAIQEPVSAGSSPGPSDWSLIALLDFAPDHYRQILRDSPPIEPPGSIQLTPSNIPAWIPDELRGRLMGEQPLPAVPTANLTPLQATLFAKSPLLNGFLLPGSDDSSILLYLYTL